MLPLFHDFEGRRVVIVGGGPVAVRKARTFGEEADVTVIAPEFLEGFSDLECTLDRRALEPGDAPEVVADAALVVPATDDRALNDAIERAGDEAGCLVNRVDRRGDVVTPSRARSEEVTIAISTGGSSPATSKYLRKQIEPLLERVDPMVALQAELREELRTADGVPPGKRREALWAVLEDGDVWTCLEDGDLEAARERARDLIGTLE